MSREKDCKWHFGLESGREQLSDPMGDHFRDDLYTSLVRESIQNSLDAADNTYSGKETIIDTRTEKEKQLDSDWEIEQE